MSDGAKCPKCGATRSTEAFTDCGWDCGTETVGEFDENDFTSSEFKLVVQQSDKCRIRQLERQFAKIRAILETAVCTEDPDKGVVILSQEGTTHREEIKCEACDENKEFPKGEPCRVCMATGTRGVQVYDHEHFSPLGDALIAAWELTDTN